MTMLVPDDVLDPYVEGFEAEHVVRGLRDAAIELPEPPFGSIVGPCPALAAADETLLDLLAQGDARAFSRLYSRHHAALYRAVRRLVGASTGGTQPAPHADEVFRQLWLQLAATRRPVLSHPVSCRAALFAAAVQLVGQAGRPAGNSSAMPEANDDERHDATRPSSVPADVDLAGNVHDPAQCDAPSWQEAGRRVLHCLQTLEPTQVVLVVLFHGEGLSLAESAQAAGLDPDAARYQLQQAQSSLQPDVGAWLSAQLPEIGTREGHAGPPDDIALRDERLRIALTHAADHGAEPGASLSASILVEGGRVVEGRGRGRGRGAATQSPLRAAREDAGALRFSRLLVLTAASATLALGGLATWAPGFALGREILQVLAAAGA